jgi:thiosulfate dehydrogenase [quinone] large subunit
MNVSIRPMTTTARHHADRNAGNDNRDSRLSPWAPTALAAMRIAFGLTFLWAFIDKTFGFGYATKSADAWVRGGNPTLGFLRFGAHGPFEGFYGSIAADAWTNVAFMLTLLVLGLALTLGVGTRMAGFGGAMLYLLMWSVYLPPTTNPIIDEHILGALSLVVLALTMAGNTWGLDRRWSRTALATKYPVLR